MSKPLILSFLLFLTGCAQFPTVGACDIARYTRNQTTYEIHFEQCKVQSIDPTGIIPK